MPRSTFTPEVWSGPGGTFRAVDIQHDDFAHLYTCPRCKAAPGEPCVWKSKPNRFGVHGPRYTASEDRAFRAYVIADEAAYLRSQGRPQEHAYTGRDAQAIRDYKAIASGCKPTR